MHFAYLIGTAQCEELNFTEFILCMWNFCTMTEADLIVGAYDCYNNDGHDGIHVDTMMKLVDEATGILSGFNVESGAKEMWDLPHRI